LPRATARVGHLMAARQPTRRSEGRDQVIRGTEGSGWVRRRAGDAGEVGQAASSASRPRRGGPGRLRPGIGADHHKISLGRTELVTLRRAPRPGLLPRNGSSFRDRR
jgi:hypothetical protein